MAQFEYNPSRRALVIGDARLTKVLQREPESCASLSEYAQRTGIPIERVAALLEPAVSSGALGFEPWGDEIFIHTAPQGRPAPAAVPEVAPNLWELLRSAGRSISDAYALWGLARGLARAGWDVEANPRRVTFHMVTPRIPPAIGLRTVGQIVPVVAYPELGDISSQDGTLTMYEQCGAGTVALVCDSGGLDALITAVRKWSLTHPARPELAVLALEAPRFAPTLLRPADASVAPRSVSMPAGSGSVRGER